MNPHWIPATWHMKSRNVPGRVRRDEYEDPIRAKRGLVVAFITWEEISLDQLPKDAFVITGADVEYVAEGQLPTTKDRGLVTKLRRSSSETLWHQHLLHLGLLTEPRPATPNPLAGYYTPH